MKSNQIETCRLIVFRGVEYESNVKNTSWEPNHVEIMTRIPWKLNFTFGAR